MNPEVSVVMSVYNDARYLPDCIESILRQEGVGFEFIVINDGSTDASGNILEEYASRDTRLKVVHQDNQGLTRSLIIGCSLAQGRYIARQDSDDISFPDRLRKLATQLDSCPGAVTATSSTVMMGPDGELLLDRVGQIDPSGLREETFCHGSLMFRREIYENLGGYRPQFRAAQDIDLQFRLSEFADTRYISDVLYAYRIREDSISAGSPVQKRLSRLAVAARDARRSGRDEIRILDEAARISSDCLQTKRSEPGTGNYFIGRCLYARRDRRAVSYLSASCKANPSSLRTWLALAQAVLLTKSAAGHDVTLFGVVSREKSRNGREGVYPHT